MRKDTAPVHGPHVFNFHDMINTSFVNFYRNCENYLAYYLKDKSKSILGLFFCNKIISNLHELYLSCLHAKSSTSNSQVRFY